MQIGGKLRWEKQGNRKQNIKSSYTKITVPKKILNQWDSKGGEKKLFRIAGYTPKNKNNMENIQKELQKMKQEKKQTIMKFKY